MSLEAVAKMSPCADHEHRQIIRECDIFGGDVAKSAYFKESLHFFHKAHVRSRETLRRNLSQFAPGEKDKSVTVAEWWLNSQMIFGNVEFPSHTIESLRSHNTMVAELFVLALQALARILDLFDATSE